MDNELFEPEDMQSPFEAIKETDNEGVGHKLRRRYTYLPF